MPHIPTISWNQDKTEFGDLWPTHPRASSLLRGGVFMDRAASWRLELTFQERDRGAGCGYPRLWLLWGLLSQDVLQPNLIDYPFGIILKILWFLNYLVSKECSFVRAAFSTLTAKGKKEMFFLNISHNTRTSDSRCNIVLNNELDMDSSRKIIWIVDGR